MAEEKIFVGSGTSKFDGNLISCSLCLSDLPQEHMFEYNGKKYIKLNVSAKKDGADEYGKTHYVAVDTFKPEAKKEEPAPVADMPFQIKSEDIEGGLRVPLLFSSLCSSAHFNPKYYTL
jgi:hypothetical protein